MITTTARKRRRAIAAIAALAMTSGIGLAGCSLTIGGDHSSGSMMGDDESMMDPAGDANAADVMFVQMMIPHHEQAVEMSRLAPGRASDPRVLDLATRIEAAQDPEIEQMRGMLERWDVPEMMDHSGHGGMEGMESMGMAGMVSEEDLDTLAASSGAEFDQRFLEHMIEHHRGAIDMAEDAIRDGADPELRTLLDAIVTAQEAEIAEMEAILAEGGASPSAS